jgi:hypothetical protein
MYTDPTIHMRARTHLYMYEYSQYDIHSDTHMHLCHTRHVAHNPQVHTHSHTFTHTGVSLSRRLGLLSSWTPCCFLPKAPRKDRLG